MISSLLKKVFGSRNDRILRKYSQDVRATNDFEPAMKGLSDAELREQTDTFRSRHSDGESLDQLLPEAFAAVREASQRALGMRHFDVQLLGGIALHNGKISEMRTGEGKTLVATLPAYLNALAGNGVHVVTVNDYLARRDAEWMGRIYAFLGLTVGINLSQMDHDAKQQAYAADITYGTNNEFGFDYLRDNMVFQSSDKVQRGLTYAIVDEVDSILIDEARTPLIISGQADDSTELYYKVRDIAPMLKRTASEEEPGDYIVDEKAHQVLLTEQGHERAEELLAKAGLLPESGSLYDATNIGLMHHIYAALRAGNLFFKDQHYVVQDDEIIIVDEFTGRLMPGRRWSDGLHQAVEAKEGVKIQRENQTLASITFQNYFRMYGKLAGMTGTADTEAYEFQQIYGLETVIMPTHRDMIRKDLMDRVFKTSKERYEAVIEDIKDCRERGQPVLVGTTSIENSELISKQLTDVNLSHQVLNAKQHAREAEIITQAGRPGMITIATNMAGRGTDIVLGGNPEPEINLIQEDENLADADKESRIASVRESWKKLHEQVLQAGGLHIVGTERHESRRVDNQLRGRAGRQGDPGSTRFYMALEDPLLRIFASDRVAAIMDRLKMPEGEAIEHPWVTRAIENAQRKVEARNFDMRKQLLEYDDVSNDQRKVIYQQRNDLLESGDVSETLRSMREGTVEAMVVERVPLESVEEQWDVPALQTALASELALELKLSEWLEQDPQMDEQALRHRIVEAAHQSYEEKIKAVPAEPIRQYEHSLMLQSLDGHWREHLAALDQLRQGIHLRGYAQKNPKQEYKREAFELFSLMLEEVRNEVTRILMTVRFRGVEEVDLAAEERTAVRNVSYQHADYDGSLKDSDSLTAGESDVSGGGAQPFVRPGQKVGRNDACPCGSGKKYKHCHGRLS